MLERKRDELAKKWQERERRLDMIRAKERKMEERIAKKRRLEEPASRGITPETSTPQILTSNSTADVQRLCPRQGDIGGEQLGVHRVRKELASLQLECR